MTTSDPRYLTTQLRSRSRVVTDKKSIPKVKPATTSEAVLLQGLVIAELALVAFVFGLYLSLSTFPHPFSPFEHFLSILGTSRHPFSWIFNGSVITLGSGLAWFFGALLRLSWQKNDDFSSCAAWGFLSSASLISVGLFSWDHWPTLHVTVFLSWIVLLIPMSQSWWYWACDWYSSSFGCWLLNKLVLMAGLGYFVMAIVGLGPMWQKVVVVTSFLWIGCFLWQLHQLFHGKRMFRIQMDRQHRLYEELAAIDARKRDGSATNKHVT